MARLAIVGDHVAGALFIETFSVFANLSRTYLWSTGDSWDEKELSGRRPAFHVSMSETLCALSKFGPFLDKRGRETKIGALDT